jgi:hypothetical protein
MREIGCGRCFKTLGQLPLSQPAMQPPSTNECLAAFWECFLSDAALAP